MEGQLLSSYGGLSDVGIAGWLRDLEQFARIDVRSETVRE